MEKRKGEIKMVDLKKLQKEIYQKFGIEKSVPFLVIFQLF